MRVNIELNTVNDGSETITARVSLTRRFDYDFSSAPQEEQFDLWKLYLRSVADDLAGELQRRVIHERLVPFYNGRQL